MKVWIAVLAILLLAALILRERYTNYEEALRDVGQTAGYITPKCDDGYTMNSEQSSCEKTKEDGTKETKPPTCPSGSSFVTRGTRGICEPSASTTPTPSSPSSSSQTSSVPASAGGGGTGSQASGSQQTCPSGYILATTVDSSGTKRECVKLTEPTCPDGYRFGLDMCVKSGSPSVAPTCSEGTFDRVSLQCKTTAPLQTSSSTTAPPITTTGGSSGNLIGPTSGGVGKTGKNVWGPVFVGLGESSAEGGDSTKSNAYPNLLGGMMGRQSSRIDGVGIVSPSQPGLTSSGGSGGFGLDMGAMPSLSSLGTEANARFLPFSRPGADPGFTADPYRLSKSYSTKNYSPENDPVPFLTDFSAFFK